MGDLPVLGDYHMAALAGVNQICGVSAHHAAVEPVLAGGRAASLEEAQDIGPGVDVEAFLDFLGNLLRFAAALCHNDGSVCELDALKMFYEAVHFLFFRHKNGFGCVGDPAPEGDVARTAPHDLYDTAAGVGPGGVPDLVNGFHGRIYGSVKANGIVTASDVQVNRSRDAHNADAVVGKLLGASKGAVASNDDDGLDAHFRQ